MTNEQKAAIAVALEALKLASSDISIAAATAEFRAKLENERANTALAKQLRAHLQIVNSALAQLSRYRSVD